MFEIRSNSFINWVSGRYKGLPAPMRLKVLRIVCEAFEHLKHGLFTLCVSLVFLLSLFHFVLHQIPYIPQSYEKVGVFFTFWTQHKTDIFLFSALFITKFNFTEMTLKWEQWCITIGTFFSSIFQSILFIYLVLASICIVSLTVAQSVFLFSLGMSLVLVQYVWLSKGWCMSASRRGGGFSICICLMVYLHGHLLMLKQSLSRQPLPCHCSCLVLLMTCSIAGTHAC